MREGNLVAQAAAAVGSDDSNYPLFCPLHTQSSEHGGAVCLRKRTYYSRGISPTLTSRLPNVPLGIHDGNGIVLEVLLQTEREGSILSPAMRGHLGADLASGPYKW